ncbi:type II secretion system protein GspL [Marimonas arenosa]|uniref:Type II secretion system protein GspL n=1 Tax=Marimonas arenosa TaxID=1795305 RepID=A0AAE3WGQ6_9RHOB|nr:type II secretion system protein GspL [Marimonas arenosa]MDQ2092213.1 type II secretion system protein GspL [Marimonas arenosa]
MTTQGKIAATDGPFDPKRFGRLQADASRPGAKQVALVPGARVTVMPLDLPKGLQGAAREKVARRQVGDLTGQPAEALDVRPFHAPGEARQWSKVLVADAAEVAAWRGQAGTACRAVLPDYLGLPAADGLWTVAIEADMAVVRLGLADGFSAPLELASTLLERAWDEADETARPKAIFLLGDEIAGLSDWAAARRVPTVRDAAGVSALGLSPPKALAHGELSFDLRRDPQAARAKLRARVLPWRWPALAGLVAAGLWATGQILATQRLDEQRHELMAATTALVRTHFVPQGPILDVRTQVSRALAARQAGSGTGAGEAGVLDVFGAAAGVLAEHRARIGLVSYGAAQGLELVVTVEDFSALDDLAAALDAAGLRVEIAQSRNVAEGAEARVKLAPAPGGGEDRP